MGYAAKDGLKWVGGLIAMVSLAILVLSAWVASRVDKHDSSKDLEDYRKMTIAAAVLAGVALVGGGFVAWGSRGM
jgi:heme A synthase